MNGHLQTAAGAELTYSKQTAPDLSIINNKWYLFHTKTQYDKKKLQTTKCYEKYKATDTYPKISTNLPDITDILDHFNSYTRVY